MTRSASSTHQIASVPLTACSMSRPSPLVLIAQTTRRRGRRGPQVRHAVHSFWVTTAETAELTMGDTEETIMPRIEPVTRNRPPDAFFAANDLMALGVLQAVREAGLDVPADVAVVGMDDTELATTAWPPLSSVSLGARERGRLAAELLLERLADPDRAPRRISVEPELVVRASSDPSSATTWA